MVFVMSLGYFVTPALLGGTANMMLAELIAQFVQSLVNWGMGGAAAFVLLVVTLALYALQLRLFGTRRHGRRADMLLEFRPPRRLEVAPRRLHRASSRCSCCCRSSSSSALSFGSSQWLIFPPPGWTLNWYQELFADPRWLEAALTSAQDRRPGHGISRCCSGFWPPSA